ncbi:MAG: hypothetical protein KDC92_08055 [Bacteroidetes bacterium]|nr:hypothetical protein [Bacteroidota bacterium]
MSKLFVIAIFSIAPFLSFAEEVVTTTINVPGRAYHVSDSPTGLSVDCYDEQEKICYTKTTTTTNGISTSGSIDVPETGFSKSGTAILSETIVPLAPGDNRYIIVIQP